jgi:hypothetical protein
MRHVPAHVVLASAAILCTTALCISCGVPLEPESAPQPSDTTPVDTTGRITDANSSAPVIDALVRTWVGDSAIHGQSDSAGYYYLALHSDDLGPTQLVEFFAPGYRVLRLEPVTSLEALAEVTLAPDSIDGAEAEMFVSSIPPCAYAVADSVCIGRTNLQTLWLQPGSTLVWFAVSDCDFEKTFDLDSGANASQMVRLPCY